MRAVLRSKVVVVALVVATSLCLTARADGPITPAQCYIINPEPVVTSCTAYLPPILDVYGSLPYDTVSAYSDCVKERCVCTGAAVSTDITTSGIYCNSSGWEESGYTTCNVFNHCFVNFWQCMNRALYNRYLGDRADFSTNETDIMADIITHGSRPGEPFEITDAYRSCRLKMCAAANSRQNCGLITCLPNYTQCDEFIRPPPLPYTHQLCTQGCRAVLLMMGLTIAVVACSICCFACCPARVRIGEPVIKEEASDKKMTSGSHTNTQPDAEEQHEAHQEPQTSQENPAGTTNRTSGSPRTSTTGAGAGVQAANTQQERAPFD